MGKVLCFLCLLILSACNRKHIQLPEATAPLPANENFSLARESNSTEMPTFQSLMEIPGLERVIRNGFTHNPRWKSQLAQLEEVRARYGLAKSDSLPSFNA
jgi:outer membrane protein TolC